MTADEMGCAESVAEREFLAASVAVWRHLDKHGRCPGGGADSDEWREGVRLRHVEKAAWEAYRDGAGGEAPAGLTPKEAEAQLAAQATTIDLIEHMDADMRVKYQEGPWWDGIVKLRAALRAPSSTGGREG